jgi:hypothetical protein
MRGRSHLMSYNTNRSPIGGVLAVFASAPLSSLA